MRRCLYAASRLMRKRFLYPCAVLVLAAAIVCFELPAAYPRGGEHHRITDVAIAALPSGEQEYLRAERSILVEHCRYLGVMLHYIQDSGSMPHVQPIHRNFHVKATEAIRLEGYAPRLLGKTPEESSQRLSARVRELTEWTEQRFGGLFDSVGVPIEDTKRLSARQLMAPAVIEAVTRLQTEKPAEFDAADTDYRPVLTAKSDPLAADGQWQCLSMETPVPEKARWLRVVLHGEGGQGAAWHDDVEVLRIP